MLKLVIMFFLSLNLIACATKHHELTPAAESYLQQGKRDFEAGYYKSAYQALLPIACDGNAEAQYAIGYMYYYGYGITQDSYTGHFWIQRAAKQHFKPAENALTLISKEPRR